MGSIKTLFYFYLLFIPITGIGQDKTEDPGARTWSHLDGRKIKAGIVGVEDKNVILKAPNGKSGSVEMAKLSKEDQEYIAKWILNNAPPPEFGKPDTIIEITTLKGEMKYNKPIITVYPGKKIKLMLRNQDDMHHNLAILSLIHI